MTSEIKFTHERGNNKSRKVTLYALSTCGHCHRALTFLREHSIDFDYVYVDQLDRKVVGNLREKLKEKFGQHVSYPFLIMDDEAFLIGFVEEKYKKLLNIK